MSTPLDFRLEPTRDYPALMAVIYPNDPSRNRLASPEEVALWEARQPLLAEAVERLLNLYRATGRLPKGALQELGAALRAATGSPEA